MICRHGRIMKVTLEIDSGSRRGKRLWLLPGQSLMVGRTELADVCLPDDPQLSGVHFELICSRDRVWILDRQSTNGTFVNGERIDKADLGDGDQLLSGRTRFTVRVASADKTQIADHTSLESAARPEFDQPNPDRATPPAGNQAVVDDEMEVADNGIAKKESGQEGSAVRSDRDVERSRHAPEQGPRPNGIEPLSPDSAMSSHRQVAPSDVPDAVETGSQESAVVDSGDDVPEGPFLQSVNATPFRVELMPWTTLSGEPRLSVIIKSTWTVPIGARPSLAEVQLPILYGDEMEEDDPLLPVLWESDMVGGKARSDIIVLGHAYAPGGVSATECDVELQVGSLVKRARVFGDRHWIYPSRLTLMPRISAAEPFTKMGLSFRRAFGGIDETAAAYCAENVSGVGMIGQMTPKSIHDRPLPNFEDLEHLIVSWDTRPRPVGFGFCGRGCMPRLKLFGTYDDEYRKQRAPLWPEDFSYEAYNGAPADQQVPGYLAGNERITLVNFSPDGQLSFSLPGVTPTVRLTRRDCGKRISSPVAGEPWPVESQDGPVRSHLDTLVLLPDQRQFCLVHRVIFAAGQENCEDIVTVSID